MMSIQFSNVEATKSAWKLTLWKKKSMHRFQFFFCTQIDIGFNSISHRPLKKHSCTIYCIKIIFMASSESNNLAVCLLSQVTLFWIFKVLYLSFVSLETDRTGRPQARSTCITLCGEEEVNSLLLANTLCAYQKNKMLPCFSQHVSA